MGYSTTSFEVDTSFLSIEHRGVRLKAAKDVLNALKKHHKTIARRKLNRTPSPGEVIVYGLVKETVNSESLAEHLARNPVTSDLVGACNVFLSHTWGSPFEDTIAALEEYENDLPIDSPACFYFIDYFAVNQFEAGKDLEKLGGVVQRCKSVVLLAKPWDSPQSLSRAWCIFELAHAVLGKSDLQLIMPGEEKRRFREALMDRLYTPAETSAFMEIFTNIETDKMEASKMEDLEKIRDFMRKNLGGFDAVDITVARGLRTWVGKTAVNMCDSYKPSGTRDHAIFLLSAGNLLHRVGLDEDDLRFATKASKIFEQLHDENGRLCAMNAQAVALSKLGRNDDAVVVQKEMIDPLTRMYGEVHTETLGLHYNLGLTYKNMELWDDADDQLTVALRGFKELEKPMSLRIRGTQTKLAQVLRDSGKDVERAKSLCKEILDYKVKVFEPNHPSLLSSVVDHARCLALEGEHAQALTHYKESMPILLKSYGEDDWIVKNVRIWMKEAESHVCEKKVSK